MTSQLVRPVKRRSHGLIRRLSNTCTPSSSYSWHSSTKNVILSPPALREFPPSAADDRVPVPQTSLEERSSALKLKTSWTRQESVPLHESTLETPVQSPVAGTPASVIGRGRSLMIAVAKSDWQDANRLVRRFQRDNFVRYSWIQEAVCFYLCHLKREKEADELLSGLEQQKIRSEDRLVTAWLYMKLHLGRIEDLAPKLEAYLSQRYRPPKKLCMVLIPSLARRRHLRLAEALVDILIEETDESEIIPINSVFYEYLWTDNVDSGERVLVKIQRSRRLIERSHWKALLQCYRRVGLGIDVRSVLTRLERKNFDVRALEAVRALAIHYFDQAMLKEGLQIVQDVPAVKNVEVLCRQRDAYLHKGDEEGLKKTLRDILELADDNYSASGDFLKMIEFQCDQGDVRGAMKTYAEMGKRYGHAKTEIDATMMQAAKIEMSAFVGDYDRALRLVALSKWATPVMEQFLGIVCKRHSHLAWAELAVQQYMQRGLALTPSMWESLLLAYTRLGERDRVLQLVEKLKARDLPLNYISAHYLISFLSQCGLFHEANTVIQECRRQGFRLRTETYELYVKERIGLHVDPLAARANLAATEDFVRTEVPATQRIYEHLFLAACFYNDRYKAYELYQEVVRLGPRSQGSLTCLLVLNYLNGDRENAEVQNKELTAYDLMCPYVISETVCQLVKGHILHGIERTAQDVIDLISWLDISRAHAISLDELIEFFHSNNRTHDASRLEAYVTMLYKELKAVAEPL